MRHLYSLILYLLIPLVLMRLLWRGILAPAYWLRWSERFGFFPDIILDDPFWIHAVSVGEVQAAIPLVRRLQEHFPLVPILVTTTTPTGSEHVKRNLAETVYHAYIPYDLPDAVGRFISRSHPRMAIIMETELWPNLFHICKRKGIPLMVANARLSQRSAERYMHFSRLTKLTLAQVSCFAVQARDDAERLMNLGADPARVHITGNIKFDVEIAASLHEQAQALRREWGQDRPVWIAASTREGEDEQILEALSIVRESFPEILLVLVPRHPERFSQVAALCRAQGRKQGYDVILRSEQRGCSDNTGVFVGDSMGELSLFYAASDIAFVGGSLVPTGGQNVLEPAALSLPVIFGPHMFNFAEVSQLLLDADAARQVADSQELAGAVIDYLQDSVLRLLTGENACQVIEENRGAVDKTFNLILEQAGID